MFWCIVLSGSIAPRLGSQFCLKCTGMYRQVRIAHVQSGDHCIGMAYGNQAWCKGGLVGKMPFKTTNSSSFRACMPVFPLLPCPSLIHLKLQAMEPDTSSSARHPLSCAILGTIFN